MINLVFYLLENWVELYNFLLLEILWFGCYLSRIWPWSFYSRIFSCAFGFSHQNQNPQLCKLSVSRFFWLRWLIIILLHGRYTLLANHYILPYYCISTIYHIHTHAPITWYLLMLWLKSKIRLDYLTEMEEL